jgi:hypothetical protein
VGEDPLVELCPTKNDRFILDCAGPGLALPELYLGSPPLSFLIESLIIILLVSNTGDYYGQSSSYRSSTIQGNTFVS